MMPGRISPAWFHDVVLQYAARLVVGNNGLRFKGYEQNFSLGVILADFTGPPRKNTAGVPTSSAKFHDWDPKPSASPQAATGAPTK
jgi:hypothetical protein